MEPRLGAQLKAGIFVVVVLLLFAISIFVLGEKTRYFERHQTLMAAFSNVAGLLEGTPVRLAGITVGRVSRIRFPSDPQEERILVELKVAAEAAERIRRDSVARIETLGFLGDKYIEISGGSRGQPGLKEGETIKSEEPIDYRTLLGEGREVLARAATIAASLDEVLSAFKEARTGQAIAETASSLRRVTAAMERGNGLLPWLINDPESRRFVQDLRKASQAVAAISGELEKGQGLLHALIYDPEGRRMVQDLARSSRTLAKVSGELEEGKGLLHALLYDQDGAATVKELSQTLSGLRSFLAEVREGKGALAALLFDQRSRELVQDLERTSKNLKDITDTIARGDGTLGGIIVDPTLYENLTDLLEGAKRSAILRVVIRSTVNSGRRARGK
ncbi:MAG: MCE family protein [candidate division NC10 bacterium]|nr:MCE family protein [candidate division NC10 bacterium]